MHQLRREAGGGDAAAGAAAGGAPDLGFAAEEPADLEAAYVAALEELAVGDFDSTAPRAYNHSFAAKAARQEGDAAGGRCAGWRAASVRPPRCPVPCFLLRCSQAACDTSPTRHPAASVRARPPPAGKMKALSKEVRGFTGRTRLPIYAASAILVRYDAGALRCARCAWCACSVRSPSSAVPMPQAKFCTA